MVSGNNKQAHGLRLVGLFCFIGSLPSRLDAEAFQEEMCIRTMVRKYSGLQLWRMVTGTTSLSGGGMAGLLESGSGVVMASPGHGRATKDLSILPYAQRSGL